MIENDEKLSRREQRREDRRDEIKAAGVHIFALHGYHSAKVSQIVREVGVAQGTFYLYFEGKEPLFGEILNDFLAMVVGTIGDWEPSDLDTREALRGDLTRVGLMLTDVLIKNPEHTKIFFRESLTVSNEFQALIREFYETLGAMLSSFNNILYKRNLIAKMNNRVLAYMTIGMVERVIQEYVVHGVLEDIPAREVVENLVTLYLEGTTPAAD